MWFRYDIPYASRHMVTYLPSDHCVVRWSAQEDPQEEYNPLMVDSSEEDGIR